MPEAKYVDSRGPGSVRCESDPTATLYDMSVNNFDILRIEMR